MTNNSGKKRHRLGATSILGWILGGLSLLDLIDAFALIELQRKLDQWLGAYSAFIERVSSFLFDWIPFPWFSVSDEEVHVLVIAIILTAAYARADVVEEVARGTAKGHALVVALTSAFIYLLIVVIPMGLLNGLWGVLAGVFGLGLVMLVFFAPDDDGTRIYASRGAILSELKGVVIVFVLLVVGNYLWLSAGQ